MPALGVLYRTVPVLALLLAVAAPASAQSRSNTEGLYLGGSLGSTALFFDEADYDVNDEGGGLNLRVGYGFSRLFTLYLGVGGARIDGVNNGLVNDEYDFGYGELGALFHFSSARRAWVPYLDIALAGVEASYDDDFDLAFRGGALALGGGVKYYVSEPLALDFGLRVRGGAFDEVETGRARFDLNADDFEFGTAQLTFGLSWFPFR